MKGLIKMQQLNNNIAQ